jgi:hypothetical protein
MPLTGAPNCYQAEGKRCRHHGSPDHMQGNSRELPCCPCVTRQAFRRGVVYQSSASSGSGRQAHSNTVIGSELIDHLCEQFQALTTHLGHRGRGPGEDVNVLRHVNGASGVDTEERAR